MVGILELGGGRIGENGACCANSCIKLSATEALKAAGFEFFREDLPGLFFFKGGTIKIGDPGSRKGADKISEEGIILKS